MNYRNMFDEFESLEFPSKDQLVNLPRRAAGAFVYAIFWVSRGSEIPLYIGRTSRLSERMGDYCEKSFTASTDFRVGQAVCYLRERGYRVLLKYKGSLQAEEDERSLIRNLHLSGLLLLNDLGGYSYKKATEKEERDVIHLFCDTLIRSQQEISPGRDSVGIRIDST